MANITGKYLNKIRKDIIEYAEAILEYIYPSPSKYKPLVKNIVRRYVENYYYQPEIEFTPLEEYFPNYMKINLTLRYLLLSTYEYHLEEHSLKKFKENLNFYMTICLIIWIANEINKLINPLSEKVDYKIITKKSIEMINQVFPFTKEKSLILITENLNNLIKENFKVGNNFFKIMGDNRIYNEFHYIDTLDKYYEVVYKYSIEDIDKFRKNEVEELIKNKGIIDTFTCISLELLTLTILKLQLLNKKHTFLFKLNLDFYKQSKNIEFLHKLTEIKEIKNNIIFIADYEEYMANRNFIGDIKMAGFTLALDNIPAVEYKNYNIFADSKIVFVTEKFLEINHHFVPIWKEKGIELTIKKDKFEDISEEELLKK